MISTEAIETADGPCGVDSADISPISQPWRPPAIRVTAQALPGSWVAAKGLITGAGGHFWPCRAFLLGPKMRCFQHPYRPPNRDPRYICDRDIAPRSPGAPLWASDVPGLVLGPFFGLLGSQIKLACLFLHSLVPFRVPLPIISLFGSSLCPP